MNAQPAEDDTIFTRIGRLLGRKIFSEQDALRVAQEGIAAKTLEHLAKQGYFPIDVVAPETTVRRRLAQNAKLSQVESERLIRVLRVQAEATQLFGNAREAMAWMNEPAEFIEGEPPIAPAELAKSDSGARLLENRMRRTAYGML